MRWEYLVIGDENLDLRARQDALDKAGRQGWELVNVTGRAEGYNPVLYMKKPLPWWRR